MVFVGMALPMSDIWNGLENLVEFSLNKEERAFKVERTALVEAWIRKKYGIQYWSFCLCL